MNDYLKALANRSNSERRDNLLNVLREHHIEFTHHHQLHCGYYDDDWIENIVVSLNPNTASKRIVIGAHYDTYGDWATKEKSLGANDNASGVVVLLKLAQYLSENTKKPIDLVFFDFEERGMSGSLEYIRRVGADHIAAMINVDTVGFGDTIIIHHKDNLELDVFADLIPKDLLLKHDVVFVPYLPSGDAGSFVSAGIPTIDISVNPQKDIQKMNEIYDKSLSKEEIFTEMEKHLEVMKTIHLAENDNIEIVSHEAINKVYEFLKEALS